MEAALLEGQVVESLRCVSAGAHDYSKSADGTSLGSEYSASRVRADFGDQPHGVADICLHQTVAGWSGQDMERRRPKKY